MMYSLNEIGLLPSSQPSEISSRKDVTPYIYHKMGGRIKLPIFVSPMPCIVDEKNYDTFENSLVQPILPRGNKNLKQYLSRGKWVALSLKEFISAYITKKTAFDAEFISEFVPIQHVCIDMANGHMKDLYDAVKKAKELWGSWLVIMIGNVASHEMYREYAKLGVDYVRVGIGGGNACSTSVLTGIHASLPWLIENCYGIKKFYNYSTNIVADGGIDTIDKAIKCLALGADFVMMGKQFAQCEEACGETREYTGYICKDIKLLSMDYSTIKSRKYYGNASKEGQEAINGSSNKPSEGVSTWVNVDTNLKDYCKKFEDALRSCMSYTGHSCLMSFKGGVKWLPMSIEEFKSYYKKDEG